jgi:hypothetical protein
MTVTVMTFLFSAANILPEVLNPSGGFALGANGQKNAIA